MEHSKSDIQKQLRYLLPKDRLDPLVWSRDDQLLPDVKDSLLRIADEFMEFLEIDVPIVGVTFTGSLANYNYTSFSDIDLHILIDFDQVDENQDLVKDYMMAKKSMWNDRHDIMIRGHEVEIYPQNTHEAHHSTGVYDITRDEWINKPDKVEADVDLQAVKKKVRSLMAKIEKSLESDDRLEDLDALKVKIKKMRQSGLERSGEFSVENLAFKVLRRNGYIENIYKTSRRDYDKSLSLQQESLIRNYIKFLIF